MKNIILLLILAASIFSFQSSEPQFRTVAKTFTPKEILIYDVSYGFITAGAAKVEIGKEIFNINHRPCYKVDVNGKSTGALDMVAKINDVWGAYIDTAAIVPHITYRKLSEGGYRKYEVIKFDHKTSFLEAKSFNFKTKEFKEPKYYAFPANVQDMISGYYYLRALNYDTIKRNDTITINTFFEDKVYDFKLLFLGKETIKTKFGKIKSLILKPIMPDNKVFEGENALTVWLSDDENKIPLKVEADLFIGSAEVTLERAENLKSPLAIVKNE